MNRIFNLFLAALGLVLAWTSAVAANGSPAGRPSIYLSCQQDCFGDYLRRELSYFDIARDAHVADFTFLIVRQPAGAGGERFSVTLTRADAAQPSLLAQSVVVEPGAQPHAVRQRLLQAILRALQAELAATPHAGAFELKLPLRTGSELEALIDPWDYWVIAPELRGEGEGTTEHYFVEAGAGLTVRRITDASKLRLHGLYSRSLSSYQLEDDSEVSGDLYTWEGRALYGHSLGERLTLGAVAVGRGSEYENLEAHVHGGPLLEFNVFPYTRNADEQLRLAYQVGPWANWYIEETKSGRMRELRPYSALSLIIDVNQPWGSVQWVGQVNAFLDDPKLHRVSTGVVLSVLLTEGLAVSLEGTAALVRDQINLRARPVTDTEILLWTVEQETDFEVGAEASISYSFGSTRNTIVNPRFGRVDLEEE